MITLELAWRVSDVGPDWDALFDAGPGIQSRRAWFEATEAAAMPGGAQARFAMLQEGGRPFALLPLRAGPGRAMASLSSPYTVLFQPLLAPGADPAAAGLALGRHLRAWPVTILEALDPDWPGLGPLLAGLRRAGLVATRFDHFGNWHEDVAGQGWASYLATRPGALRETIRRRGKAAGRDGTVRFDIVRGAEGLDAALAAYEAVYARSWKVPEPYPDFNAALLHRLAEAGALRLGVMWQGDMAIAAQYWTVGDGVATVLKLAHDDAAKALSPGTLLTAHMIRTMMEEGGVTALDFGRGDDPYKRQWAGTRRQRVGVMLATPWRPAGLVALGRHAAGAALRALRNRRAGDNGSATAHIAALRPGEPAR